MSWVKFYQELLANNILTGGNIYATLTIMRWVVEYYEQTDTTQPAEEFETGLNRDHKKLGAK